MNVTKKEMRKRYRELYQRSEEATDGEIPDEELTERIRLFYELHPHMQYWRDTEPDLEPKDIWPVARYGEVG